MEWMVRITLVEAIRNYYKILYRKPEGKRPLAKPRHRWEDI
jgi:hypothetical protein